MKKGKIAITAFVITILTVSSKFIGFIRDVLIAANYGTTIKSDAYIMSQAIIAIISSIIIASLTVAFIPMLSDYKANKTEGENKSLINNVYTITSVVTGILCVFVVIFADMLIDFFAPGFSSATKMMTKQMVIIMSPTILISSIVLLNNSYLQTNGKFYIPTLIGYPSNGAVIFALLFLTSTFGITGLAVAFSIGTILQLLFQWNSLKKADLHVKPEIDLKNEGVKSLMILVVPTIIGSSVNLINMTADRMIGSTLGIGSVAALSFSNKLILFVLGIVSASVTSVFYTSMSNHSATGDKEKFNSLLKGTINSLNLFLIPATVGFIVLSGPIVNFVFARGKFDHNSAVMTASCLMFFSIGLIAYAIRDVLARSFYAIQDTRSPMINGILSVGINVLLIIILSRLYGVGGLALATSISSILSTLILAGLLYKKIGDFGIKDIGVSFLKILLASITMGVAVLNLYNMLFDMSHSLIMSLSVSVAVGLVLYGFVTYMLKISEFIQLIEMGLNGLKKIKRGSAHNN